jgi:hypothetical protein
MYEVELNADPEHFLDWDKPLSEQPESVITSLGFHNKPRDIDAEMNMPPEEAYKQMDTRIGSPGVPDVTGEEYYRSVTPGFVSSGPYKEPEHAKAAEYLRSKGIPGIKYLDQGSRDQTKMKELAADLEQYRKAAVHWAEIGDTKKLETAQREITALEKRLAATHNYVVFDESLIKIMRKYGISGLFAALGGAGAAGYSDDAQAQTPQAQGGW